MPENYEPIPLNAIVGDEEYVNAPFRVRDRLLDGVEEQNLKVLGERYQQNVGDPKAPTQLADSTQTLLAQMRRQRFNSLKAESGALAQQYSEQLSVPLNEAWDMLHDPEVRNGVRPGSVDVEAFQHLKNHNRWINDTAHELQKRYDELGAGYNTRGQITTEQGVHMGELNVFKHPTNGKTFAAASYATSAGGQFVPQDQRDPDQLIELDSDRAGALKKLDEEKAKLEAAAAAAKQDLETARKMEFQDPDSKAGALQTSTGMLEKFEAQLSEVTEKQKRWSDGPSGMTNFLHDQAVEKIKATNLERFPHGSNFLIRPTADAFVGWAQQTAATRSAFNAITGDTEEAKSLAAMSQEMESVRAVWGMGQNRNSNDIIAESLKLISDQAPQMVAQFGVGRLVSMAAQRGLAGLATASARRTFAEELALVSGKGAAEKFVINATENAAASMAKRWGDKVGAVIGSLPMSFQDAASNMSQIYDQVDALEAEAAKLPEGPEKEAKLKDAQQIEGNAAKAFTAHFISTGALEFLPLEGLLARRPADKGMIAKIFTGASKERASVAAKEGAEKAVFFSKKVDEYMRSKLPARVVSGLENGSQEAITEVLQLIGDNAIAKEFYNENQQLFEGMGASAYAGMFIGGVMGFMTHHASPTAVQAAVNSAEATKDAASKNYAAAAGNVVAATLEDGSFALPVEHVVKFQEGKDGAAGKWIVQDPEMPEDSKGPPEFATQQDAELYAQNRWERYGLQKITDIMSQTRGPEGQEWTAQEIDDEKLALRVMLSTAAKAAKVSKETVWKSYANALSFEETATKDYDLPDPSTEPSAHSFVIGAVEQRLANQGKQVTNPQTGALEMAYPEEYGLLQKYKAELEEWEKQPADARGDQPKPDQKVADLMSSIYEWGKVNIHDIGNQAADAAAQQADLTRHLGAIGVSKENAAAILSGKRTPEDVVREQLKGFDNANDALMALTGKPDPEDKDMSHDQAVKAAAAEAVNDIKAVLSGTFKPAKPTAPLKQEQKATVDPVVRAAVSIGMPESKAREFVESARKTAANEKGGGIKEKDPVTGKRLTAIELMDQLESEGKPRMGREFSERRGYTKDQIAGWENHQNLVKDLIASGMTEDTVMQLEGMAEGQLPIPDQFLAAPQEAKPAPQQAEEQKQGNVLSEFEKQMQETVDEWNKMLDGQASDLAEATEIGKLEEGAERPSWLNPNGTIELNLLLRSIPDDTPMGRLAHTMADILPLLLDYNDRFFYRLHPSKDMKGVLSAGGKQGMIVGDGPATADWVGAKTTISELLGHLMPRMTASMIDGQLDSTYEVMRKTQRGMMEKNPRSQSDFERGHFADERNVPSIQHLRTVFQLAMPWTDMPSGGGPTRSVARASQTMKTSLTRAVVTRVLGGRTPKDNELILALAAGRVKPGPNPPTDQTGQFYAQRNAAGNVIFYRKNPNTKEWHELEETWPQQPFSSFNQNTSIGKLASIYARAIIRGGHWDTLYGESENLGPNDRNPGDTRPTARRVSDGLADTILTRAEYEAKGHKMPWAMTSLSRFVAEMMGNPAFAAAQEKAAGWIPAAPNLRKAIFNVVVGDYMGSDTRATDDADADAISAAAMMASNINMQRKVRRQASLGKPGEAAPIDKSQIARGTGARGQVAREGQGMRVESGEQVPVSEGGIPGASPLSLEALRAKAESQSGGSYEGGRQDTTGTPPVAYDEYGREMANQPERGPRDTDEISQTIPATMEGNKPFADEAEGREFMSQGQKRKPTMEDFLESERNAETGYDEDSEDDGENAEDQVEAYFNSVNDTHNYFSAQLQAAQEAGKLPKLSAKGEAAMAEALEKTGIADLIGKGELVTYKDRMGGDHSVPEPVQARVTRAINDPRVTLKMINSFLGLLAGKVPKLHIDRLGAEWHDARAFGEKGAAVRSSAIISFLNARRKRVAVEKGEKRWESLTEAERESIRARMRAKYAPSGFEAGLMVKPIREDLGKAKPGEEEGSVEQEPSSKPLIAPVKAVSPKEVVRASTSPTYSQKGLLDYVRNLNDSDPVWYDQLHDGIMQLGKIMGIELERTFKNSEGKERIKVDSLHDWGRMEEILAVLSRSANPAVLQAMFPQIKASEAIAAMLFNPAMIHDMHAVVSSFVDKAAMSLKKQGKRVMLRTEPPVQAMTGLTKENETKTAKVMGKDTTHTTKEKESAGPFVVVDPQDIMADPAFTGLHVPVTSEQDPSLAPSQSDKPIQTKPDSKPGMSGDKAFKDQMSRQGLSRDFQNRSTRLGYNGGSVARGYTNGLIPYYEKENEKGEFDRVPLTDNTPFSRLGGKTVMQTFQKWANQLRGNATLSMLETLYNKAWRQALAGDGGMKAIESMLQTVTEQRQYGTDLPLVSPDVSESRSFSPATAISKILSDHMTAQSGTLKQTVSIGHQGTAGTYDPSTKLITIFKSGNPSTLIHETVHWLRHAKLSDGSTLFQASLGDSYEAFMGWATDGGKITDWEQIEERIAYGAEKFLRQGNGAFMQKISKTQGPVVVKAFQRLAKLLRDVYQNLKGLYDPELTNEARKGYDALFGAEQKTAARPAAPAAASKGPPGKRLNQEVAPAQMIEASNIAYEAFGVQVAPEKIRDAILAERNMDTSEMPFGDGRDTPKAVDDPATTVWHGGPLKATLPHGWTPPAGMTHPEPRESELRLALRNGAQWVKRWFGSMRGVGWNVFRAMQVQMSGTTQSYERRMLQISNDILKATQAYLKDTTYYGPGRNDSRQKIHREINSYLTERDPAARARLLAALPTDQIRDAAAVMRNYVDDLSQQLIDAGIVDGPMAAVVSAQKGFYLHRSYAIVEDAQYVQKLRNGKLQPYYVRAIQVIMDTKGVSEAEARRQAEFIIQAAGNPDVSATTSSPTAQGVGVLMERTTAFDDVAEARDLLWGLRQDPVLNFQKTVSQMGQLIAMDEATKALLNDGLNGPDQYIKHRSDPVDSWEKTNTYFFDTKQSVDPALNPVLAAVKTRLAGYRTTPEVAQFVTDLLNDMSTTHNWAMRTMMTLNNAFKISNTVMNWTTAMRNFYTAMASSVANAHVNPRHYTSAISLLWKESRNSLTPAEEVLMQELMSLNIAESATIAEMRDYFRHGFDFDKMAEKVFDSSEVISWADKAGSELQLSFSKAMGGVKNFHVKLYNGCDTAAKIAAYLSEKERVAAMFPHMSPDEVQGEAARRTHKTMFSFDMLPRFILKMRRNFPVAGPFVSYPWSMMRTTFSIIDLAYRDMKEGTERVRNGDPGGAIQRRDGIKRLSGLIALGAVGASMSAIMRSILGWDMEDDKVMRGFLPPWEQQGNIVWLSKRGDEKLTYLNLSNMLPLSIMTDAAGMIFREAMGGFRGEDVNMSKAVFNAMKSVLQPFAEEQYITQLVRFIGDQRDGNGTPITNAGMSAGDMIEAFTGNALSLLTPGHIKNALRLDLLPQGRTGQEVGNVAEYLRIHPKELTDGQKLLYATGIKVSTINIPKSFYFKSRDWTTALRTSVANYTEAAKTNNQIPKRTLDTRLAQAEAVHEKVSKDAFYLINYLNDRFDFGRDKAEEILKDVTMREGFVTGGKLDSEQIDSLMNSGTWAGKAIKITAQQFRSAIEAAEKYQPIRESWLREDASRGKIKVVEGR